MIALAGAAIAQAAQQQPTAARSSADRECLARAMYFESDKSSEDGMLAVGTVVANRVSSGRYGGTFCGVVGQRGQFAAGVMTRGLSGEAAARARRVAEAVLAGHRHPAVKSAMFFHTAGLRFGYGNMHYLTVAGGNIFYEKRSAGSPAAARANALSMARAYSTASADKAAARPVLAAALRRRAIETGPVVLARVIPVEQAPTPIRFGAAPLPSNFELASAYQDHAAATPAANSALAAVAALGPKKSSAPRVIAPAAAVQASMTPVMSAAHTPKPSPMANYAVAQAWASFN